MTTTRAAREKVADEIVEIATSLGARAKKVDGESKFDPRTTHIEIEGAGGLNVSVRLEPSSKTCAHVLCWNIGLKSPSMLTDAFGDVNTYHFRKATHVAMGLDDLIKQIKRGLKMAQDGSAFRPAEEVKMLSDASDARYKAMLDSQKSSQVSQAILC